jgi:hypothetical protein
MGCLAAGAVATAASTLLLVAFGAGLGLSAVSPWSDTGVSASTFNIATGIYLVIVGAMSSAIGGYLAGRLRTKWIGIHSNEVFFRDTAHGLVAWAFATLISATALVSTTAYLANGAVAGVAGASSQAARSVNPSELYVDKLFRASPVSTAATPAASPGSATENAPPADQTAPSGAPNAASSANAGNSNPGRARAEILRLWTADFRNDDALSPDDRTYVAQVVAARTGLSQANEQACQPGRE